MILALAIPKNVTAAIPLERAGLCISCEYVVALQSTCPACGSAAVVSLARFLNREK